MRANVYVDGFNLYYAVKKTPYRWLDLAALCDQTLKGFTIHRIRYFTARVKARAGDPLAPQRQDVYLRALRTIPHLEIHEGHFLASEKWAALARPPASGLPTIPGVIEPHPVTGVPLARVIKVEEKGSDVNIATYLLLDALRGDFEMAVLISNDSDLVGPIRVVRSELKLDVGVLNPHKNDSVTLKNAASFYRPIREGALLVSQFPDPLYTPKGPLSKPTNW
ncbi:MAG: hypothetical protein PVSMB4_14550 [Ktedonobacterales bacterium]